MIPKILKEVTFITPKIVQVTVFAQKLKKIYLKILVTNNFNFLILNR